MTKSITVPMYRNPSIVRAAHEVGALLQDYNYSPTARAEVVAYTIAEGTPSGCPSLDAEDEQDACQVMEESFDPVPFDDLAAWGGGFDDVDDFDVAAWDAQCATHDAEQAILDEGRPAPDDTGEWPVLVLDPHAAAGLVALPPIAGGSDEAEPFEPTAEDLDWWAAQIEARQSWLEQTAAWNDAREAGEPWAGD